MTVADILRVQFSLVRVRIAVSEHFARPNSELSMRVLLVEDSVAIHKVAKLGLGAFPASELRICDSVSQVDSAIGNFEPEIVIVSDAMALNQEKTGNSGVPERFLERLIKSKSNVIVLTESAESDQRLRAQGYPALLRKPFKLTEFRDLVGQINGKTEVQAAVADVDNPLPEVTIDLKALGLGTKSLNEPVKKTPELKSKEKVAVPAAAVVQIATPTAAPAAAPAAAPKVAPVVSPLAQPRVTPRPPAAPAAVAASAAPQRPDVDVRAVVEKYLNQNWALFTKSLTANVQKSIEQDRSALVDAEFQDLRQRLSSELGGLIRNETEAALRSWMGEFSRDVLKEVAREELQKLLESDG